MNMVHMVQVLLCLGEVLPFSGLISDQVAFSRKISLSFFVFCFCFVVFLLKEELSLYQANGKKIANNSPLDQIPWAEFQDNQ